MKRRLLKILFFIILCISYEDIFASTYPVCHTNEVISSIRIISYCIYVIKILVPGLLIVSTSYNIFKSILNNNDDIKKDVSIILKKFIVAALIFFIPSLFFILLNTIDYYKESENNFIDCAKCLTTTSYCDKLLLDYPNKVIDKVPKRRNEKTNIDGILDNLSNVNEEDYKAPTTSGTSSKMKILFMGHNAYDDSILIVTNDGHTIYIDGGLSSNYKKKNVGIKVKFDTIGIKNIDALFGSHMDKNHVESGGNIITDYNVKHAYYPVDMNTCFSNSTCHTHDAGTLKDAIKAKNIPTTQLLAGDSLSIGDIKIYVLAPVTLKKTTAAHNNSNSLIFILVYKNTTFMFTGDMPGSYFKSENLKPYADKFGINLDVDVFKYPHHGNTTLKDTALSLVKPEAVIVPNYSSAQYPSSENVSRIKNAGSKMYRVSDSDILLTSDGNSIAITTKVDLSTILTNW